MNKFNISVLTTDGEIEDFKPVKIRDNLIRETNIQSDEAEKIKNVIVNRLKKSYSTDDEVSTTVIRGMVIDELIKRGFTEEAKSYKIYGVSNSFINNILENSCRDNANIMNTTELVNKYICDAVWKPHALDNMTRECAEAHKNGYIHIHDLEYFELRPNCCNWDIRWFARNNLMVDGEGKLGSVAKPAKKLEVLVHHLLEVMGAGTQVLSGGQAFSHWNVFLAPFARGRTYEEVKQCMQHYIFSSNMQGFSRGGQSIFSSINLEFEIPDFLKDIPAIGASGVEVGVYGDYQQEADMIFKAVCEVLKEKDAIGRYHTFPNTIFVIRENTLDEYSDKVKLVHELLSENPTIYFMNCIGENSIVMGCLGGSEGIWTRHNNEIKYYTFEELSEMFNCDYGVTDISKQNIEVLTIDDNKNIIWHKVSNFIKNKDRLLYKVHLNGNKSFICDDLHEMITYKGMNGINVLDATKGSNLLDVSCTNLKCKVNPNNLGCLYGFWLGDGEKNTDVGRIRVSKDDKKEYLENLFKKLNISYEYNYSTRKTDNRHHNPNIHSFKFDKSIFENIDFNDLDMLAGILSGCISSDGYVRVNGKYTDSLSAEWVSTNSDYSKLFKYCCFMLGLKFSSRWIKPKNKNHNNFERVYISCNNSTLHLFKQLNLRNIQSNIIKSIDVEYRDISTTKNQRINEIELYGKGDSYCIEVNDRMIFGEDFILSKQCRTRLSQNYSNDWEKDLLNVGNFHYTTLNLPLLALESKNLEEFKDKITYYMNISREVLFKRRENVEHIFDIGMSNFLLQKDQSTGEPIYDIDRCSFSIGLCGLNEALLELYDKDITEIPEIGEEIVKHMSEWINEYKEKDGLRWSLFFSPAESTAHRFAEINKNKYPNAHVQGEKGSYYLTNSSHINVSDAKSLGEQIKNADRFHKYAGAGNILHLWLGEAYPNPEALYQLNKKIAKTHTKFWAFTNDYTYCRKCGFAIQLAYDTCPICNDDDVVVMSRITGYYQPVSGYNDGKKKEFKQRYRHKLSE